MGLLSQSIHVQGLKNPWPRSSPGEEREEGTERGEERRQAGRGHACLFPGQAAPLSAGLPSLLILQASHLKTKIPLSAEIKLEGP